MWQRVQTLYLAVATLLIASLFWSDVALVAAPDGFVEHISYTSKPVYLVWLILLTLFQVLSLGGFKWRMKQFRVAVVTAILCIGFQLWLGVDYFRLGDGISFSWTALFPFAACVLDCLACRAILQDEALVQSASRLRLPRSSKKH